ncbi:MAG: hypothetical protein SGBAC_010767, partial [Bacillariaceae sp.]
DSYEDVIYDKNRDLEFIQDADQIEGVDIADRDYVPHDEPDNDNDLDLQRFYDIEEDKDEDLLNQNTPFLFGDDLKAAQEWNQRGFDYNTPLDNDDEDEIDDNDENKVNDDNADDDLDSQQDELKDTPGSLVTNVEELTEEQIQSVIDRQDVTVRFDEEIKESTDTQEDTEMVPIEEQPMVDDSD